MDAAVSEGAGGDAAWGPWSAGGVSSSSPRQRPSAAPQHLTRVPFSPQVEERPEKDFTEKGPRSLPGLSAAALASLGGTSPRRGSGDTSVSVDTEASIREMKTGTQRVIRCPATPAPPLGVSPSQPALPCRRRPRSLPQRSSSPHAGARRERSIEAPESARWHLRSQGLAGTEASGQGPAGPQQGSQEGRVSRGHLRAPEKSPRCPARGAGCAQALEGPLLADVTEVGDFRASLAPGVVPHPTCRRGLEPTGWGCVAEPPAQHRRGTGRCSQGSLAKPRQPQHSRPHSAPLPSARGRPGRASRQRPQPGRDALVEAEEKYRKAMVSSAQLDNEKTLFMYQVDTLKDTLLELEEQLAESRRQCEEKGKVHGRGAQCGQGPGPRGHGAAPLALRGELEAELERERHAHSVLQFQFAEAKEALRRREEMLEVRAWPFCPCRGLGPSAAAAEGQLGRGPGAVSPEGVATRWRRGEAEAEAEDTGSGTALESERRTRQGGHHAGAVLGAWSAWRGPSMRALTDPDTGLAMVTRFQSEDETSRFLEDWASGCPPGARWPGAAQRCCEEQRPEAPRLDQPVAPPQQGGWWHAHAWVSAWASGAPQPAGSSEETRGQSRALERQKEFFDSVRSERDDLREEVVALREELKKLGVVFSPDLAANGETAQALDGAGLAAPTKTTEEGLHALTATGASALAALGPCDGPSLTLAASGVGRAGWAGRGLRRSLPLACASCRRPPGPWLCRRSFTSPAEASLARRCGPSPQAWRPLCRAATRLAHGAAGVCLTQLCWRLTVRAGGSENASLLCRLGSERPPRHRVPSAFCGLLGEAHGVENVGERETPPSAEPERRQEGPGPAAVHAQGLHAGDPASDLIPPADGAPRAAAGPPPGERTPGHESPLEHAEQARPDGAADAPSAEPGAAAQQSPGPQESGDEAQHPETPRDSGQGPDIEAQSGESPGERDPSAGVEAAVPSACRRLSGAEHEAPAAAGAEAEETAVGKRVGAEASDPPEGGDGPTRPGEEPAPSAGLGLEQEHAPQEATEPEASPRRSAEGGGEEEDEEEEDGEAGAEQPGPGEGQAPPATPSAASGPQAAAGQRPADADPGPRETKEPDEEKNEQPDTPEAAQKKTKNRKKKNKKKKPPAPAGPPGDAEDAPAAGGVAQEEQAPSTLRQAASEDTHSPTRRTASGGSRPADGLQNPAEPDGRPHQGEDGADAPAARDTLASGGDAHATDEQVHGGAGGDHGGQEGAPQSRAAAPGGEEEASSGQRDHGSLGAAPAERAEGPGAPGCLGRAVREGLESEELAHEGESGAADPGGPGEARATDGGGRSKEDCALS
ncbi:Leucine-rich repeat flightless-interacting protein 1 [Galemys pyrenaicus]|uniref:Leucine-rich repeat flightless-interacting protein 1 n=1 Tax=Galemys pyrenaicus TaxID=202257 RepID=A0A8J6ABD4_GALPY|nr:Leucine-rich repeat flightless-interacting protein 1 [Galemys pyrenaicus]